VSFNEDTAEIYDADVELLSSWTDFTIGDENVGVDLASVVTHEAGHFLGLNHTLELGATMRSGHVAGTLGGRALSDDDRAGICAIYPEDRDFPGGKTCEPRGKYSPKCENQGCGCHLVGTRVSASTPLAGLGAAFLIFCAARRRRRPLAYRAFQ
jgi:hypothetical protein